MLLGSWSPTCEINIHNYLCNILGNFGDEILIRRVECNIPKFLELISIIFRRLIISRNVCNRDYAFALSRKVFSVTIWAIMEGQIVDFLYVPNSGKLSSRKL